METTYDNEKNKINIQKHGVSFQDVSLFEWEAAITTVDDRHHYGEERFISYGMIKSRLYILIWTPRKNVPRPISFRKANKRERRFYEQNI